MLITPDGQKYAHGNEERMFRYFVPSLVKALRSIHCAETNDVHYEGPTIEGVGVFHELTIPHKIVALHIACERLLDRYAHHAQAQWVNGALECVYSWMFYQITQEFLTGDTTGRTFISKTYQQWHGSDTRISATNNKADYWLDLVNKLAHHTVYTPDTLKLSIPTGEYEDVLKVTEDMIIMANRYFDDGMPASRPAGVEE